jgi:hypothetical protein
MNKSLTTDRRSNAVKAERQAARQERQAAKADIGALNAFLDGWADASQAQKIAFVRDLSQIIRRTIRAAVL